MPRPTARQLIEAPIDTGDHPDFIDRGKKRKLSSRTHPYGKHPAFPEKEGNSNFEELMASEQYQTTLQKLNTYMARITGNPEWKARGEQELGSIILTATQGLGHMKRVESEHKTELERLAIELVFQLPKFKKFKEAYDSGEFKIVAKLESGDLDDAKMGEPGEPEAEQQAAEEVEDMDLERQKRRFINAMIQGGAVGDNYSFHMVQGELNAIDPQLVNLYGLLMGFSEIGYFIAPEGVEGAAAGDGEAAVGSERVRMEDGIPVIYANGAYFPVLVQEVIKGMFEMVSMHGLPQEDEVRKQVIDKEDLLDNETWAMLIGRGLWRNFIKSIPGEEDEITMFLYNKLVSLPPREFNQVMKQIQVGGPQAAQVMRRLSSEIKHDMENQDADDYRANESAEDIVDRLLE